ncbi:dolichyl-phosphate-mannose--protein mannosyltransferase [Brevibacterium sp. BRM-1]|uniref:dolichyl-phosphate-mannose--protein mannosyltransferase n=1 Tax=Brevibacterium sp. BRM-1 TaxID=2999062 RepID=UPI002E128B73
MSTSRTSARAPDAEPAEGAKAGGSTATATTGRTASATADAPSAADSPDPTRRLTPLAMGIPPAAHPLLGWLIPAGLAVIGAVLRFWRLGFPHSLVFDETYYVKDAYALSQSGYERNWAEKANDLFNQGDPSGILTTPEYVVHPPLGKWILSLGIDWFGVDDSFGWRFSAALFGALSIFILARIATRMFSSVWLGGVAGLLLCVDGEHFVHSRTGLLDLFVMFFVLVAFGCLILDRDWAQRRLGRLAALPWRRGWLTPARFGPSLGLRPWRLAAGISLGLSMGVKWSGLYALAAFGIMAVCWDWSARRRVGVAQPLRAVLAKDAGPAFVSLVPVALVTYVLCWSGWIFTSGGYDRQWGAEHRGWWSALPDWLTSLAHYHYTAYKFHVGLDSEHPYMSNPWGWIVQWKPTSFFYESPTAGQNGCTAEKCSSAITSVGNPVIWGAAVVVIVVLLGAWALRRDWRAGAILAGLIGTWGPWFLYQERTIFTFYTIVMVPFVVLGLTYCLGLLWGTSSGVRGQRLPAGLMARRLAVGLVLAGAVFAFCFFYPVYTGEVIPYDHWQWRMLNPSWI